MKDKRLEELSDEVRKGHPIGLGEALEVIEYQQKLRKDTQTNRENLKDTFWTYLIVILMVGFFAVMAISSYSN
jgi:hypothetical protein